MSATEPQQFPALRFAANEMRKNAAKESPEVQKYATYVATYLEWMSDQGGDVMTYDPIFAFGLGQLALKATERGIVAKLLPTWDELQQAYPLTPPPAAVMAAGDKLAKTGVSAPPPTFDGAPAGPPPLEGSQAPRPLQAAASTRLCPVLDAPCTRGCAAGTRCGELVSPEEVGKLQRERDLLFNALAEKKSKPSTTTSATAPATAPATGNGRAAPARRESKSKAKAQAATAKPTGS